MSHQYIPDSYNLINPNVIFNGTNQNLTNPLSQDLDMGLNKIINLSNPGDPNDGVNLSYLESVLPNVSGFVENPLTENLDCGTKAITNADYLQLNDLVITGDQSSQIFITNKKLVVQNSEVNGDRQLLISVNETYGLTSNTDFFINDIINVKSLQFSSVAPNSGFENITLVPSTNGQLLTYDEHNLIMDSTLQENNDDLGYLRNNQNCDFGNHQLNNISSLSISGNSLSVSDGDLLFNSDTVINSSNISQYVSQTQFNGTASSDLNMMNYSINNALQYKIAGDKAYTTISDNTPSFGLNQIVTYPSDVLETIIFNNDIISSPVQLNSETPAIINNSVTITKNSSMGAQIFDFSISVVISENYTIDPSTFYILVDIWNINQLSHGIWLRINYGEFTQTGNILKCNFNTSQLTTNVLIQNTLTSLLALTTPNFIFVIYAYGDGLLGANTYIQDCNILCNIVNPSSPTIAPLFYSLSNNNNTITTYDGSIFNRVLAFSNVSVPLNATTSVYTIELSNQEYAQYLIELTVLSESFAVKSCIIVWMSSNDPLPPYTTPPFSAQLLEASASSQNIGNFHNTILDGLQFVNNTINPSNVDIQITTNGSGTHAELCSGYVQLTRTNLNQ